MKRSFIKLMCVLCAAAMFLSIQGCAAGMLGENTDPDTPIALTPEQIESIFAEISFEEQDKYPDETDDNGNCIVFWLDGGSVWHISQLCPSIKGADPAKVKQGSIQSAFDAGKKRECKVCGDGKEVEISNDTDVSVSHTDALTELNVDKYQQEYSEDGKLIVFWLESSNVWHISRYCSSLSRSDPSKIIEGFESDAIAAGKERPCKTCSK